MKTFRMIGMALFAVLMCVNFAACSSDDDEPETNEEGVVTNEKKLVEMTETGDTYTYIGKYEFSYDSKGRLEQVIYKSQNKKNGTTTETEIIEYTWGDNAIYTRRRDYIDITYSLTKDIVTKMTEKIPDGISVIYNLSYNNSKELTKISHFNPSAELETEQARYNWVNGNIDGYIMDNDEIYEIEYTTHKNKGWWYSDVEYVGWSAYTDDEAPLFYAHPELLGKQSLYLPKIIKSNQYWWEFFYEFDNEGYITKCTARDDNEKRTIYTYKWE